MCNKRKCLTKSSGKIETGDVYAILTDFQIYN